MTKPFTLHITTKSGQQFALPVRERTWLDRVHHRLGIGKHKSKAVFTPSRGGQPFEVTILADTASFIAGATAAEVPHEDA